MSSKKHILFTKVLSEHRRDLLLQMIDVSEVKALEPVPLPQVEQPEESDWVLITSPYALITMKQYIESGWGANSRWACVGFRSREKAAELGIHVEIKADSAKELVKRLPSSGNATYLCGKDRTPTIEDFMGKNDWELNILETYWTQPTHPQVNFKDYDAVAFFSPRNVKSMLKHNSWPARVNALAIGPTTAEELVNNNIQPTAVASYPDVLLLTQQFLETQENGTPE